jgi:outer membrane protein assembly factor BamB
VAFDRGTGDVMWRLPLGTCDPPRARGPVGTRCDVAAPAVPAPEGDLYVAADGVYRVGAEGTIRWHYPPAGVPSFHVDSTPLALEEVVVFGGQDGFVTALAHDGTLRWQSLVGADVDGTPARLPDGTIAIGADGSTVRVLDATDGRVLATWTLGGDVRGGIAVGADGTLFVGSLDGRFYALDPANDGVGDGVGAIRFVVPTGDAIASTPTIAADGRVLFGGRDDQLYAVDPSGRVDWRLALSGDIEGQVAIAPGGTLIVGCDDGVLRGLR